MKGILLATLLLFSFSISAQESDKEMIQHTIEAFFDGFHKQDSVLIKKTISKDVIVQTIGRNKQGKSVLRKEDFSKFLKSIVSIPDSIHFEEKLLSYNIQVDGAMANAWTSYEFWINNSFSHCGVNSFQLFKDDEDGWKIIYLIDTRRREGCN